MKSLLKKYKFERVLNRVVSEPEVQKAREEIQKEEFAEIDRWFLPLLSRLKNWNGEQKELEKIWKGIGRLDSKHVTNMFRLKLRNLQFKYNLTEIIRFERLWTEYKSKIIKKKIAERLRKKEREFLRKKKSKKIPFKQ